MARRSAEITAVTAPIAIGTSKTACAGTAAVFLLRSIAAQAGFTGRGPSHNRMFFDCSRDSNGRNIAATNSWFQRNSGLLTRLGYRIVARRVAFRADWIANWVSGGGGFRGAILQTNPTTLHPQWPAPQHLPNTGAHAVVLSVVPSSRTHKPTLMMVDPWPGIEYSGRPLPTLSDAHEKRNRSTLVLHWSGWS